MHNFWFDLELEGDSYDCFVRKLCLTTVGVFGLKASDSSILKIEPALYFVGLISDLSNQIFYTNYSKKGIPLLFRKIAWKVSVDVQDNN